LKEDIIYFKKKLGLSDDDFNNLMQLPVKSYQDYKGYFSSSYHIMLRKFVFKIHSIRKLILNQ
jgi:hypothetical protein